MRRLATTIAVFSCLLLAAAAKADQQAESQDKKSSEAQTASTAAQTAASEKPAQNVGKHEKRDQTWRWDPKVLRRPGSYLGGGIGYAQGRVWYVPQDEDFKDKQRFLGPTDSMQLFMRAGDAFFEWFAVGFQIDLFSTIARGDADVISAFGLLLDLSFYPWKGLGIRPSVGIGFSYAQGKEDFELGYGWPADFSLTINYEIRISRSFVIAPMIQTYYIYGKDFHGLYLFFGLEFLRWFKTATG